MILQGHIVCDNCYLHKVFIDPRTGNQGYTCRGPITDSPNILEKMNNKMDLSKV